MNKSNSCYDELALLRKRFMITFLGLLFSGTALIAQENITVTGTVTSKGESVPLLGVNVIEKGTTNGVVTGMNGDYTIDVPAEATLVFTYLGFKAREIPVDGQTQIDAALSDDLESLDDVVVVGYGTQRREDLTGSVASVDAEEVNKVANSSVANLLQGRASGVTVTSGGQPGADANVRIRGVGTFGDNQPLYVVDGVPVGTSIRDFNPNDIESIQILKDASAGAIYGSRAANGVVIITTKDGVKNTPLQIKYSGYFGIDEVAQEIPVLGREDYQMTSREKTDNAGWAPIPGNDPSSGVFVDDINTYWQKVGLKSGTRQNHNVNFSGGSENMTYNASLDYLSNEGMFVGSAPSYERYSGRINTSMEKGIFKVSPSLYYTHSSENSMSFGGNVLTGGRPPLINDLVISIPTLGLYDENNEGGYAGTESEIHNTIVLNVPGINNLFQNTIDVDRIFAIVNPELKLIDDDGHNLTYKLNLSYDKTHARDFYFVPEFEMGYFFNSGKSILNDNSRIYTVSLIENTLNYSKKFGRHGVELLLGQTFQKNTTRIRRGYSESLPKPYFPVLSNGNNQNASGEKFESTLASYFGRFNYNFDDRYLVTGTIRRDGSSRFAPANRYGTFPSIALGWRLSNEEFFPVSKDLVNQFKLRASYGTLGNQNIGDYLYQAVVNRNILYNFGANSVSGGLQTSLISEDILWESTTSLNIGFDASFFNDSFDLMVEYYDRETSDVLVGVPIPASTGSINTAPVVNAGRLRNSGVDMEIAYNYFQDEDLNFTISANASTVNNEVLSLGGNEEPIYGSGSKTVVGGEIGRHFGYVYDGIFQTQEEVDQHAFQRPITGPGDIRFKDINGDDIVNADDRTFLGSALPSVTYGLNFSGQYKNFDFSLFASGAAGYYINSRLYRTLMWSHEHLNSHVDILDRWTPENTNTNIPKLNANDAAGNSRDSNRPGWLQKGDYLRVNTVSLGYSLPVEEFFNGFLESTRIYTTVQNLHTFTAYKGFNPDFSSGVFEPGFDNGTYPRPRTYMLGVQLAF